jgi:hypothetical protein
MQSAYTSTTDTPAYTPTADTTRTLTVLWRALLL